MINLRNIEKKYKDNLIFDNVNFDFKENTSYAITGINGCGKSVLLKIICGFSSHLISGNCAHEWLKSWG